MSTQKSWLSLKEAAARLGVHLTTLRRWADRGQIPVMLTPGGHRRFDAVEVEQMAIQRRRHLDEPQHTDEVGAMWAQRAITLTRRELVTHADDRWMTQFDEIERERSRLMGQRLMGLTLQYASSQGDDPEILIEAHTVGHAYGVKAKTLGLPLTDALHAALFFRDALVEAAIQMPDAAQVRHEANKRLLRRINAVLNTVQLAIAEVYDPA